MFKFFEEKKSITSTELAVELWEFCLDISGQFQGEVMSSLENSGLELNSEEKKTAILEVPKLNLWIISKTLPSDKVTLEKLHHLYASAMEKYLKQIGSPKTQLEIIDDLIQTYKIYYNNWNDKSGGEQTVLATEILQQLLNNGKFDKKFMSFFATFIINEYLLKAMQATLDLRNNYEII